MGLTMTSVALGIDLSGTTREWRKDGHVVTCTGNLGQGGCAHSDGVAATMHQLRTLVHLLCTAQGQGKISRSL